MIISFLSNISNYFLDLGHPLWVLLQEIFTLESPQVFGNGFVSLFESAYDYMGVEVNQMDILVI